MTQWLAPQWVGILIGFGIGAAAQLWGIANPESIIRLCRWRDRLFVGCVTVGGAVAVLVLFGVYALGIAEPHFGLKSFYIWGILVGGIFFGVGMAASGYFPGSEWMALGEGRRDALFAVPAGLMGALAWTALNETSLGQWLVNTDNYGEIFFFGKTTSEVSATTMFLIAIPFAICLLLIAWFVKRFPESDHVCLRAQFRGKLGHDEDNPKLREAREDTVEMLLEGTIARKGGKAEKFAYAMATEPNGYSKLLAGVAIFVGLMIVLGMYLHQIFGESTTYSWIVANTLWPDAAYSQQIIPTIGWEPFSDIGTYLGAFFSAVLISKRYTAYRSVIPPSWRNRFGPEEWKRAIGVSLGSFVMIFGARMAGGCASGHILSGTFQMAASGLFFAVVVIITAVIAARLIYGKTSEKVHPPAQTQEASSSTMPRAQCTAVLFERGQ